MQNHDIVDNSECETSSILAASAEVPLISNVVAKIKRENPPFDTALANKVKPP